MNFNTTPDYRAQAEKCMEWAECATDAETELHWLYMAEAYRALAGAQETEKSQEPWGDASLLAGDYGISLTKH